MLRAFEYIAVTATVVLAISLLILTIGYATRPTVQIGPNHRIEENQINKKVADDDKPFWKRVADDPVAFFTFWLTLFTLVLAAVGVIQLKLLLRAETVAEKSARAAELSADIARNTLIATNRPWVSVNLAVLSDLWYNAEGEARIEIAFILKNTGNTPANNVTVDADIVPFMRDGGIAFDDMKAICERVRGAPEGRRIMGHTIFPDDTFTYRIEMGMPKAKFENVFADHKVEFFTPVIVGCVSYLFPFEAGRHLTEFIVDLRKKDPANQNAPGPFRWAEGKVSKADVVLTRSFSGGNAD